MSIKHNEVREFRAELLSECCKDVSTEPVLQKPAGETLTQSAIQSNEACVDVTARRLWVKEVPYFDVKVVNPT